MGLFLLHLTLVLGVISCNEGTVLTHIRGRTMGTHYNVKIVATKKLNKKQIKQKVDSILSGVNQQMSTYLKSSEISYFNESERIGAVKISKDFFDVTKYAIELSRRTNGMYDPTVGPLVNIWGFGPDGKRIVPSQKKINQALKKVGHDKISLDDKTSKINKKVSGVYLDLSSVAKGFGVDKVSHYLEQQNFNNYMVEIGGELKAMGVNEREVAWSIAIERPTPFNEKSPIQEVLELKSEALATSGNYRNFFSEKGEIYSHTINPHTGVPVPNILISVSVVHENSCMKADALATALMSMGLEKGFEFAQKNNLLAYFIYKSDIDDGNGAQFKVTNKFNKRFSHIDTKSKR